MVLPVPGGPQKIERAERAGLEHAGERAVGAEQMILADHVGELVRPQLVGERPRRVALETGGREQAWSLCFWARAHPENITDICWPPRMMVMRHCRPPVPATRSRSAGLSIF